MTNKYNITFIHILLIHYIFKRWKKYINIYHTKRNHVDFKYVHLQILWKKKMFSRYIDVQLNEIMKIQMHFQSNYLIFLFKYSRRCGDFERIFKNEICLFSFRKK